MKITIEEVIFKSLIKQNKLVYRFETRETGIIQIFSSHKFTDGSEKQNVVSLHKQTILSEIIAEIISDNKTYQIEKESSKVLDYVEINKKGGGK